MRVLTVPTNGTKSVGSGASVQILPANQFRSYAAICNPSTVGLWISLGADAVIGTGIYIPPNGGMWITDVSGLYRGAVNGIMATGGAVVLGTMELQ